MGKADTLEGPGGRGKMQKCGPRILTNMRFHESPAWVAAVTSLYPDHGRALPPRSAWAEARALCTATLEWPPEFFEAMLRRAGAGAAV